MPGWGSGRLARREKAAYCLLPLRRGSFGTPPSRETAGFSFDRLIDVSAGLALKRHGVLYAEYLVSRPGARLRGRKIRQTAAARDESVDEVAVKRVGEGTQAFERDAILGFGIFLLDDELPR